MESVPCNLCRHDDAVLLTEQRGFRIVRCRNCGLVYVNPRPASEELVSLYGTYHARNGGDEASWDRLMQRVFRETADLLCLMRTGVGRRRLLDVGCGFGGFVALMQERGWDAEGVDPSPSAVQIGTRRGRPIRLGTLEGLGADGPPYDVVTMFYVLEHLANPMAALQRVSGLLAPAGTLLLRVPHTTPIVRLLAPFGLGRTLYDPPFHLYDFSPPVLTTMLNRVGFTDVRTFPGKATRPPKAGPRFAAALFGTLAAWAHVLTVGRILLPGVSTTTIARKPSR
jgi:SAM-dependent methyltransferase